MSPGGRSKDGRQPGTLHGDRLTPSVPATRALMLRMPLCSSWNLPGLTDLLQNLGDFQNDLVQRAAFFCQGPCNLKIIVDQSATEKRCIPNWISALVFFVFVLWFFLVYLVDEDGATQAPSASLTRALKGAVLGDDHHVSSHTTITGLLCRQSKVEAVASVVFHNEKDTRRSYLGRKVIC